MRVKKYLSMVIILMFLASLALVSVPVKPSPVVTFYVDMPPEGYIPAKPLNSIFSVDVYVDASELPMNDSASMAGWGIDVQVDPAVLEVMGATGGVAGYFLYDFLVDYGYNSPPSLPYDPKFLVGNVNKTTGYINEIVEIVTPPSPGGAAGKGKLCSVGFKVKNQTAYSLIDISLYQYDPGEGKEVWQAVWMNTTKGWFDVAAVDGHYNAPPNPYLHSVSSLIDLSSPVTTSWHELYPTYCTSYSLNNWLDGQSSGEPGYGELSPCDNITLDSTWYHVEEVTITLNTTPGGETTTPNKNASSVPAVIWTNPTDAYTSNDVYASSNVDGASQAYGTYGFSIPGGSTILKVEVGYEAYTATNERIAITCSWNGGDGWATPQDSGVLGTFDPDTVTWFDFADATAWTADKLSNANFRTNVTSLKEGGGGMGAVYLDYIPARVTYAWGTVKATGSPSTAPVGTWTNATHAYSSNDTYAIGGEDTQQRYGNYSFSIPGGSTILKVEVGYEAYTATNERIAITCSWNGGDGWATPQDSGVLGTFDPDTVTWFDFADATAWTADKLSNANFCTNVTSLKEGGGGMGAVYLDYIPARVLYIQVSSMYMEFLGGYKYIDEPIANASLTYWQELRPGFGHRYVITGWTDSEPSGNLTAGDVIEIESVTKWMEWKYYGAPIYTWMGSIEAPVLVGSFYVDDVSTDIIVSGPIPAPTPEFPLGLALEIGLIAAIVYVWWRSRRKTKITKQAKLAYPHHQ